MKRAAFSGSSAPNARKAPLDDEESARRHAVRRILIWILIANLLVASARYFYGIYSGLISVRADGLHAFTDGASNVVGLLALRFASAPPDPDHPYGHRKIEVAASLGIALMILVGMAEIIEAIRAREFVDPTLVPDGIALGLVGATLGVNIAIAGAEARAGKRLKSAILRADARHTMTDSLATVLVLIGLLLMRIGYSSADVAAAALVVILIFLAAFSILRMALSSLLDKVQLDPERIRRVVLGIPDVEGCHAIRSRGQPDHIFVDLHLLVRPDMTVRDGHILSHRVTRALKRAIPEIADVMVHLEPSDDDDRPVYEQPPKME